MSIKDLEKDTVITDYFLIKSSILKEAVNGFYLDLLLIDKTGEVSAKLWKCTPETAQSLERGSLVKVQAKVEEYRGSLQLNITKIRKTIEEDGIKKEDYLLSAPFTGDAMYSDLMAKVASINKADIKKVLEISLARVQDKLRYYPAAKSVHHYYQGGLLYHILTMIEVGEKLLTIYPFLDRDLVLAGIILHDLEKTNEMLADEFGVIEYTVEGNLLGHLVKGVAKLEVIGKEEDIDPEVIMVLEHLILSHHYKAEYGSPKAPMLPEAELLHYIDNIDSKMHIYREIYETIKPGTSSERIYTLDNRTIYKPSWR